MTNPRSGCLVRLCEFEIEVGGRFDPCGRAATRSTDIGGGASYWCAEHAAELAKMPKNAGVEVHEIFAGTSSPAAMVVFTERIDLEILADRLAWWMKTRRFAGSTNPTIESKIAETRLELRILHDRMMARRAASNVGAAR